MSKTCQQSNPRGKSPPSGVRLGDVIWLNGDLGRHGIAIMAVAEGLEFETEASADRSLTIMRQHASRGDDPRAIDSLHQERGAGCHALGDRC